MGLYGPKVVWVFYGWFSLEFWRQSLDDVPCSEKEMEQAADGAFVIGFYVRNRNIERGIAGLTGKLKFLFICVSSSLSVCLPVPSDLSI